MRASIAYIDDNPLNLECVTTLLEHEFEVQTFSRPDKFLELYDDSSFSAILVDIHMPSIDGFELYEKIIQHPHYNGCPILFISSDDSDSARIKSFALGAVDFLNRMIRPEEMVARINSKILYYQRHRSIIEFSNLTMNLTRLKVFINDSELYLTFIEFKILCFVLQNHPALVTKEQLIQEVWRTDHVLDATIYTHLSNLNTKLEAWDFEIHGMKSRGIQLKRKVSL